MYTPSHWPDQTYPLGEKRPPSLFTSICSLQPGWHYADRTINSLHSEPYLTETAPTANYLSIVKHVLVRIYYYVAAWIWGFPCGRSFLPSSHPDLHTSPSDTFFVYPANTNTEKLQEL